MANNISKWIDITGKPHDLCEIYRWLKNFTERTIHVNRKDSDFQLGAFVEAFDENGARNRVIDNHGWSSIDWVDWSIDGDTLMIMCTTPYGNLSEFMPWLRQRFPRCEFHCYVDNPENDYLVENDFD